MNTVLAVTRSEKACCVISKNRTISDKVKNVTQVSRQILLEIERDSIRKAKSLNVACSVCAEYNFSNLGAKNGLSRDF